MNLGLNMYAENRQALCTRPRPQDTGEINKSQKPTVRKPKKEESKESKDATEQEYNFIASMIRSDSEPQERIKISFPGDVKAASGGSAGSSDINTINIEADESNIKKKETMMKEFDDIDINEKPAEDDENDLLDLMDA